MYTVFELLRTYAKLMLGKGSMRSYAQFGEDAIVSSIFRGKTGVYVDVGSFHPTLYSNTYARYQNGWKGVVIDPEDAYAPLYAVLRPRDRFVSCAVGPRGEGTYYSYADRAYNSLVPVSEGSPAAVRGLTPERERRVQIRPLGEILEEAGITSVDFLSVDAEGMDLAILDTHDWTIMPRVIAIEDEHFKIEEPAASGVYQALSGRGYRLHAVSGPTLIFKYAG
jgi:FkbM family methyltransferase